MNSTERLVSAMRGEPVDRPPFSPFLAYFWEAQPAAVRNAGQLAFLKSVGADPLWRCSPGIVRHEIPGLVIRDSRRGDETLVAYETPVGTLTERYRCSPQGNTRYLVQYALRSRSDYEVLAWMEEHTRITTDASGMRAHFAGNGAEGLSLGNPLHSRAGGLVKSAFQQLVEHWVGTEQLAYTLHDDPDLIDLVLEPMLAANRTAVSLSATVEEYDYFLTFEDSSTQNYSPAMYERYIAPEITEWGRILGRAGKQYVQHACGHVRAILPAMKVQGIWGVESLTPPETGNVSIRDAREVVGPEFGIIGGIDPVQLRLLPTDALLDYVDRVLDENAGGVFILANADSCPPDVAPEKFRVISDHLRRRRC